MAFEVRMPQMGESIAEGTVVRWFKKPGDRVERDEPLFEISTDKVDTEVPSPASGFLAKILVREGETVAVDTPVCLITSEPPSPEEAASAVASQEKTESAETTVPPAATASAAQARRAAREETAGEAEAQRLSPAVRRLVREHGIDISRIQGSGEGGRVTREDVLAYLRRREGEEQAAAPPRTASLADRVEPMSIMRRKIAEHMIASRRTSAHVSTVHEADMSGVAVLRGSLKKEAEREGVRLTYLPFVAQAVARTLREFPLLNASIEGENIRYHGEIHLGIAVALDEGLLVPVVRRADTLSVFALARAIQDLAERARAKRLRPEEVQGGTFTITNPGVFGSLIGTPIINQPQVAILCLGAVVKRPVVLPGTDAIAVRSMAYLTLTFDHRLIDGAVADRFVASVRRVLEEGSFEIR